MGEEDLPPSSSVKKMDTDYIHAYNPYSESAEPIGTNDSGNGACLVTGYSDSAILSTLTTTATIAEVQGYSMSTDESGAVETDGEDDTKQLQPRPPAEVMDTSIMCAMEESNVEETDRDQCTEQLETDSSIYFSASVSPSSSNSRATIREAGFLGRGIFQL